MLRKVTHTSLGQGFLISLGITLFVYILRGLGILSGMPGFVLLALVIVTLVLLLWLSFQR